MFYQWWEVSDVTVPVSVSSQNFYKSEINKEEMYIRYIHKLCDMHLQAENFNGTNETATRYTRVERETR